MHSLVCSGSAFTFCISLNVSDYISQSIKVAVKWKEQLQ